MTTTHRYPAAPLAALLLITAGAAQGASTAAREQGVHAHGHGVLEVAVEGHELHLALHIPAVNVLGFEHAARTDAQRDAVQHALATFKRGQDLFVPSAAARCALDSAEVALGAEAAPAHATEHGHTGKTPGPAAPAAADGETHSELRAEWRFHCAAPDELARVTVKLFEHLLEVEELDARIVTPTLQSATELRRGNATLELGTR
jgi:hypothetical protein